jgi:hypothetical protein
VRIPARLASPNPPHPSHSPPPTHPSPYPSRAEITALCRRELEESDGIVVDELNRYAAAARLRAQAAAAELADRMAREYEGSLASHMAALDSQRAANAAASHHAASEVVRLTNLLAAVRAGRDPGDDVSALAASFPLLPAAAAAAAAAASSPSRGGGAGSPGSPGGWRSSSPREALSVRGGSPLTVASALSPRTRSLSPGAAGPYAGASASSSFRSPAAGGRSASAEPARTRLLSPGAEGGVAAAATVASVSSAASPLAGGVLAALEARDAASLGLNVARARREMQTLMDKTLARWARLGGAAAAADGSARHGHGHGPVPEMVNFLRTVQGVMAVGSEPDGPAEGAVGPAAAAAATTTATTAAGGSGAGVVRRDAPPSGPGVNLAAAYAEEAARLGARARVEELRKRVEELRKGKEAAAAHLHDAGAAAAAAGSPTAGLRGANSPARADAIRVYSSLEGALKETEKALRVAQAAVMRHAGAALA